MNIIIQIFQIKLKILKIIKQENWRIIFKIKTFAFI